MRELKGKILFKSINGAKQRPVKVCPLPNKETGLIDTGQNNLVRLADGSYGGDVPLIAGKPYIITSTTYRTIENGSLMDLDNSSLDKLDIYWMIRHPYIVADKSELASNRDAIFYIENLEKDARSNVSSQELKIDIKYYILKKASEEKQRSVANLLQMNGADNPKLDIYIIQNWLLAQVDSANGSLLNLISDYFNPEEVEKYNMDVFIRELRKFGIIRKGTGNVWKFGESGENAISLGKNNSEIASFIKNENNIDVFDSLENLLESAKNM